MSTTSKRAAKTDETDSWPFIRWIESRNRWQVDARTATGGKRTFHETKREAEGVATTARIRKTNEGSSAFDDRELAKYGWTVQQAIRFAVAHLRQQEASVPVKDAVKSLVEAKKAAGRSAQYCKELNWRLTRFVDANKDKTIAQITAPEIEAFLSSLKLAAGSWNTYRRDLCTLWSHALKSGFATTNEAEKCERAREVSTAPGILTAKQVAALLAAPQDDDILAAHSLGLFAGLRVSEIEKLDWKDVDLARGYVHVSAATSKTRSRRLVPILDILRAWITPIAKKSGKIIGPNFRRRSAAARNAAGFKPETTEQKKNQITLMEWPENALRHSFVSYRLASTNDAAKTALESGHDQSVLFAHYREIVSPRDAERYFNIRPAVAETARSGFSREERQAAIRRLEMGRKERRAAKAASNSDNTAKGQPIPKLIGRRSRSRCKPGHSDQRQLQKRASSPLRVQMDPH